MNATITLQQFEAIDGLNSQIICMGDFMSLPIDQARHFVRLTNRLFDACIDAVGYDSARSFPSAEECAATIITGCLSGTIETVDLMECAA